MSPPSSCTAKPLRRRSRSRWRPSTTRCTSSRPRACCARSWSNRAAPISTPISASTSISSARRPAMLIDIPHSKVPRPKQNLKDAFRRRKPGEPPLSLFRAEGRRRRLQRRRRRVPLDRRRRDRPCAWPSRILEEVGDPATGLPIGATDDNLKAAIAGETHEYTDMYPGMARTAREEGFDEIADWFETLAKAEKSRTPAASRRRSTRSEVSRLRSRRPRDRAPGRAGSESRPRCGVFEQDEQ
jgi:hypothetical protein